MNRLLQPCFFSFTFFLNALSILCSIHCTAPFASAEANVRVEVTPNRGTSDDTYELKVILDGRNLDEYGDPRIEESDKFTAEVGGVMRNQVYVNGKSSENKVFTYYLTPEGALKPGKYRVPAISFRAGGKEYAVNEPDIEIIAGSGTSDPKVRGQTEDHGTLDFTQAVDESRPYVGQQILYRTELVSTKQIASGVMSDIPFDGFWHEPLGKPKEDLRQVSQVLVRTYESAEALFPNRQGVLTIPARVLTAEVQVAAPRRSSRSDPWDALGGFPDPLDLIRQSRTSKKKYMTKEITVTALPLPAVPPGFPPSNYIPVGLISLVALADRFDVKVGESISYSIEITGDGNLRPVDLPQPTGKDLEKFKIYPDQTEVKTFPAQDKINFKKRFPVSLIPRSPGTFELPNYSFTYFDPAHGQYKILSTPHRTMTVVPGDPSATVAVLPEHRNQGAAPEQNNDLLPQHTGPETYLPAGHPSKALLFFLTLIYPAFIILTRWIGAARKRLEGNEFLVRQKRAFESYNRRLAGITPADSNASAELFSALRVFLGDKLGFSGESATAGELLKQTDSAKLSEPLRSDLAELVRELERSPYSGGTFSPDRFESVKKRTTEVVKKLEHEVRS